MFMQSSYRLSALKMTYAFYCTFTGEKPLHSTVSGGYYGILREDKCFPPYDESINNCKKFVYTILRNAIYKTRFH